MICVLGDTLGRGGSGLGGICTLVCIATPKKESREIKNWPRRPRSTFITTSRLINAAIRVGAKNTCFFESQYVEVSTCCAPQEIVIPF